MPSGKRKGEGKSERSRSMAKANAKAKAGAKSILSANLRTALLKAIEANGGVAEVSRLTGIPYSQLYRLVAGGTGSDWRISTVQVLMDHLNLFVGRLDK